MSVMQRAVSAYGQASHTLAPIQQIVMLYDGAIRKLKEARAAIEDTAPDTRGRDGEHLYVLCAGSAPGDHLRERWGV